MRSFGFVMYFESFAVVDQEKESFILLIKSAECSITWLYFPKVTRITCHLNNREYEEDGKVVYKVFKASPPLAREPSVSSLPGCRCVPDGSRSALWVGQQPRGRHVLLSNRGKLGCLAPSSVLDGRGRRRCNGPGSTAPCTAADSASGPRCGPRPTLSGRYRLPAPASFPSVWLSGSR